jgi:hypothetical protein
MKKLVLKKITYIASRTDIDEDESAVSLKLEWLVLNGHHRPLMPRALHAQRQHTHLGAIDD